MDRSKTSSSVAARRFTIGDRHHSAEAEAERAATSVTSHSRGSAPSITPQRESNGSAAPDGVQRVIDSGGQPLDGAVRSHMEQRFAHRFSDVRVHSDSAAASSANMLDASAYTVGKNIVFGGGRYAPHSREGQALLAHELTHVVQSAGVKEPSIIRRQPKSKESTAKPQTGTQKASNTGVQAGGGPATPRKDYVFIMGKDRRGTGNPFYTLAERYFRAHLPAAQFETSTRNLADLLSWISTNVKDPIGNIYIVSHANEDGTLSFALNSADADARTSVPELRGALHPAGGGASSFANVKKQIDSKTKIHIKGCDIGRTQEMVELLDEAFGGAGTVTAPTHEQVFGTDPQLEKEARAKFKADVESHHPMPAPVDPSLKGKDKIQATADRQKALKHRQEQIKAEMTARKAEGDKLAEEANTYEAFSGPMFQRPGTKLYTESEIKPQVDALYTQLSDKQRAGIVKGLIAADPRSAAVANANGTFQQKGQRVYKRTTLSYTMEDPQTAAEANALYAKGFREEHFRATGDPIVTRTPTTGGFTVSVSVPGKQTEPGGKPQDHTMTMSYSGTIPNDASLLADGKKTVPNPDRYAWRVASTHARGKTTRQVIGERVVAYLHHQSLDPSAHQHFDRPESDPRFFATSTFDPNAKKPGTSAPPPKVKKP
jgi:hypothetical protein